MKILQCRKCIGLKQVFDLVEAVKYNRRNRISAKSKAYNAGVNAKKIKPIILKKL
jgi:hypothetical protein